MKQTILAFAALLVIAGCGEDEPTAPDNGTTKTFPIAITDRIPCSETNGQAICVDLGYTDCLDWNCRNYDNTGVFIYEVVCWKP